MKLNRDDLGITYCKPRLHIINFYCDNRMIHRVFEPAFKRHVFVPMKEDIIELEEKKYEVIRREIRYKDDRLVAFVYMKNI